MADETTLVNTPSQFFEELLPRGFAAQQAEGQAQEDVTLQYVVTGDGGGEWTVKIESGKMAVENGRSGTPLVVFTISATDLLDAINARNGASPVLVLPAQRRGRGTGAVKALRGTMALNLTRPGAEPFKMETAFNAAAAPRTVMTIAIGDYVAIQEGKMNGQEAFMTGKMRVEGDMGFLMQVGMAVAS